MRRKLLIASLVSLGMIAGLTACSGGDEGQATEEVTIATVQAPPVDQSADTSNQAGNQQQTAPAAEMAPVSQGMDQQATTNDSGAMQQQAPADDGSVTTSTTISETVTTTTPVDANQAVNGAAAAPATPDAGAQNTMSAPSNGSNGGADSSTQDSQGTSTTTTTESMQQTSQAKPKLSDAKKLAENSAGDNGMSSANGSHEKVEPPTNGKNLQNPVNDEHEVASDSSNNDQKANVGMSNGQ